MIDAEYKYFFESNNFSTDRDGFNNPLYKVQIYNNRANEGSWFGSSATSCKFCKNVHKDNCDLDCLDDRMSLADIIRADRERDFTLVVYWKASPQAKLKVIESPHVVKHDFTGMSFS